MESYGNNTIEFVNDMIGKSIAYISFNTAINNGIKYFASIEAKSNDIFQDSIKRLIGTDLDIFIDEFKNADKSLSKVDLKNLYKKSRTTFFRKILLSSAKLIDTIYNPNSKHIKEGLHEDANYIILPLNDTINSICKEVTDKFHDNNHDVDTEYTSNLQFYIAHKILCVDRNWNPDGQRRNIAIEFGSNCEQSCAIFRSLPEAVMGIYVASIFTTKLFSNVFYHSIMRFSDDYLKAHGIS